MNISELASEHMYLHVPILFPMLLVPLELPRKTAFFMALAGVHKS